MAGQSLSANPNRPACLVCLGSPSPCVRSVVLKLLAESEAHLTIFEALSCLHAVVSRLVFIGCGGKVNGIRLNVLKPVYLWKCSVSSDSDLKILLNEEKKNSTIKIL